MPKHLNCNQYGQIRCGWNGTQEKKLDKKRLLFRMLPMGWQMIMSPSKLASTITAPGENNEQKVYFYCVPAAGGTGTDCSHPWQALCGWKRLCRL